MSEAVPGTPLRGRLPAFKAPRAPFPLGSRSPPLLAAGCRPRAGKRQDLGEKEINPSRKGGKAGRLESQVGVTKCCCSPPGSPFRNSESLKRVQERWRPLPRDRTHAVQGKAGWSLTSCVGRRRGGGRWAWVSVVSTTWAGSGGPAQEGGAGRWLESVLGSLLRVLLGHNTIFSISLPVQRTSGPPTTSHL